MNLTQSGALSANYAKVYDDNECRVVWNKKEQTFVVYRYDVLPATLINSDSTHNRYGERFASQKSAQAEFNRVKSSTNAIVRLNTNELQ